MSQFTTSDGLSLDYSDEGTGPPVLCLAGLTRDKSDFDELSAVIGGDVRLIRLTSRGRNGSDRDPNHLNYTVPIEARDVLEFLDFLNLEKTLIVGTSRGGLIAMVIAAMAPDRLSGVLLNDIGPEIAHDGIDRIMGYLGKNPPFGNHEEAADRLLKENNSRFSDVSRAQWLSCAKRWWRATADGLRITYDPKLRDALKEAGAQPTPDLWPLFDALENIPLALIRGANSDLLSRETVQEMTRRRPDMIYAEIPNRGHVPFLNEPESISVFRALLQRASR